MKLCLNSITAVLFFLLVTQSCNQQEEHGHLNQKKPVYLQEDEIIITKNKFDIIQIQDSTLVAILDDNAVVSYNLQSGVATKLFAVDNLNYEGLFNRVTEYYNTENLVSPEPGLADIPKLILSRRVIYEDEFHFLLLVLTQKNTVLEDQTVKALEYKPLMVNSDLEFESLEYKNINLTQIGKSPLLEKFHIYSDSLWIIPNLIMDYRPDSAETIFYRLIVNKEDSLKSLASKFIYDPDNYKKGLRGARRSYLLADEFYSDGRFLYHIFDHSKIDLVGSKDFLITKFDVINDTIYTVQLNTNNNTDLRIRSYFQNETQELEIIGSKELPLDANKGFLSGNCLFFLTLNDDENYEVSEVCI